MKEFLKFGVKVALALVVINVANALVARLTGVDILGKINEIAGSVTSA